MRLDRKLLEIVQKRYSPDFFAFHIVPVVNSAMKLAKKVDPLGAWGLTIVEIAAYLHDIARFTTPGVLGLEEDHHIVGAAMAREILEKSEYDDDRFIKSVEYCIKTHRGKKGRRPETTEAQIVACADAIAHFDGFLYVLKLFFDTCPTYEAVIQGVEAKMERDWAKLILPEAREMSEEKYRATRSFIDILKGLSDRQIEKFRILIDGMIGCLTT